MTFREMDRERLEEYVRVFLTAFGGAPWNEPWTAETASRRLDGYLNTGSAYGLELREDDEIVAFILGQYEPYYDGLRFCAQEFCCARRGGGYGTKLLGTLEERLREQGIVRVCLMTIHGEATEGYYGRRGYTTDEDTIWMYKKL